MRAFSEALLSEPAQPNILPLPQGEGEDKNGSIRKRRSIEGEAA